MIDKYWKILISLAFVLVMSLIVWLINGQSLNGIDDANIYFIYMRNLANGNGFVYNIGSQPVEGFTSLLWTLTGSFLYMISRIPQLLLLILNIIFIAIILNKFIALIDRQFDNGKIISRESVLFLMLLAFHPGFFEWMILSLMETGLWFFIISLLTFEIIEIQINQSKGKELKFNILIFLLVLTRPEAMLWALVFIAIRFIILKRIGLTSSVLRSTFISIITYLVVISGLTIWRLWYFGYPLPNTYYAKVTTDVFSNLFSGGWYDIKFFLNYPLALITIILSIINEIKNRKNTQLININIILTTIIATSLFVPLLTGGDHFNLNRFHQPIMPLIWITLILTLNQMKLKLYSPVMVAVILIVSLLLGEASWSRYSYDKKRFIGYEWDLAQFGKESAEKSNVFFDKMPEYPVQGVTLAGAQAYYYKGFTYDLLGLNNAEMAHSKREESHSFSNHRAFNKQIFMKQHPDIFWMGATFISKLDTSRFNGLVVMDVIRKMFGNILFDKEYQGEYSNVLILRKDYPEALAIFASNRFLSKLDTSVYEIRRYRHVIDY
jgi:hypothetical protein